MGQVLNIHSCWFRFSSLLELGVSSLLSFLLFFGTYGLQLKKMLLYFLILFMPCWSYGNFMLTENTDKINKCDFFNLTGISL